MYDMYVHTRQPLLVYGKNELQYVATCMTVFRSAKLLSCVLQRASGLKLPSSCRKGL